jgi:hypothetical protein
MASCPHCGKQEPAFDGQKVTCQRCGNITQVLVAQDFLTKAHAMWPGAEVTLRSGRVAKLIERHDEYLKKRGDYDIITETLYESWMDDAVDEYLYASDANRPIRSDRDGPA